MSDTDSEYMDIPAFDINIYPDQQSEAVTDFLMIAIKCEHKCNCYASKHTIGEYTRPAEYYYYHKHPTSTTKITQGDLIQALVVNGYSPRCVHNQLDGFIINKNKAEAIAVFSY